MTKGAPGQETRTAIYYIAETGLQNFQMGWCPILARVEDRW